MRPLNMGKPPNLRITHRVPRPLYGALGQEAGREGVSLNQLCLSNRFLFISGLKSLPQRLSFLVDNVCRVAV